MTRLVLASGSESRARMLKAAGVAFEIVSPDVDEAEIKQRLAATGIGPESMAKALAGAKALTVSVTDSTPWVIGADQILVCEGRRFDKADSLDGAREVLRALRDREHTLVTAVALARDGKIDWQHVEVPSLWMRAFSDDFLDRYLVDEGEDILSSVGCYRIEEQGAHLFERTLGDQFTIRGLPLLPLLAALRERAVIAS